MKLKKIASLALAGVMAVSMLAGCATKAPETGDENATVTTESTVATDAFNGVQDQVKFTSDATLQDALEKALKACTATATEDTVEKYIISATGMSYADDFDDAAGDSTVLVVKRYNADAAWSAASAAMQAAKGLTTYDKTTYVEGTTKTGDKYVDFTYDGIVAVASASTGKGDTAYYVAYAVTQHGTEKTYTGKGE